MANDGSYTPEQAAAIVAAQQADPVIIPPTVNASLFGGLIFQFGHKITTKVGSVNIADQEAAPDKPPDKAVSFSTYGVVIPVSLGRRRLSGNVIESSAVTAQLVGTYDYFVDYQIPITTTDEIYGGIHPDNGAEPQWDWGETNRVVTTKRVFQNNDSGSSNWVDVEDPTMITLIGQDGVSHTFRFTTT